MAVRNPLEQAPDGSPVAATAAADAAVAGSRTRRRAPAGGPGSLGTGAPGTGAPGAAPPGIVLGGYSFADSVLLRQALTHRSAAHDGRTLRRGERRGVGSNERLEFIGDRVLGLLIAEWLLERHPVEQEGELGQRQARLVSKPVLAEIAGRIGIPAVLALAPGEARAGVGSLATVLADALEAVIGAIYLDGGLDAARRFVRDGWAPVVALLRAPPKDPKTRLQEWLLGRGKALPSYRIVSQEGPSHAPLFLVEASGGGQVATGSGGSKRVAEREAAAALLGALQA